MGIQNFDHSHHKLKIRGLQSPVDVLTFEGREQLSTPFRYDIQFTSTDKAITPELVLMQDGAFSLTAPPVQGMPVQTALRTLHGVITGFKHLSSSQDEARYEVRLEPRMALLARSRQNAIYQNQTVPQIVEKILRERHQMRGQDFVFNLKSEYPSREQVMQYGEDDLTFISRLLSEVGIWFRFATDARLKIEVVEFYDDQSGYERGLTLPLRHPSGLFDGETEAVWGLNTAYSVVEKSVTTRDYNYRTATAEMMTEQHDATGGDNTTYGEAYHYADNFLQKGDKEAAESGAFYARIRHERYLNEQAILQGQSTSSLLMPGLEIRVQGDDAPAVFRKGVLITGVTASAARDRSYELTFTAIPYSERYGYRPALIPRPVMAGTLPARVTSTVKNDIYAHIDKDGRYRVNLDFDRDTWKPGYESLWVRQSRPYAGDTYGLHLPLLAGTEVSIAFEEGNPDRPYIAGNNADIGVVKNMFIGVGQALSVFVRKAGIKLFANKGAVSVQAQNDLMELLAQKSIEITSTEDEIKITAKKKITLNGGGSYIRLDACGIEAGTPGEYNVKAGYYGRKPKAKLTPELMAFPVIKSEDFNQSFILLDENTGQPLINWPYELELESGLKMSGITDENGNTELISSDKEEVVNISVFEPDEFLDDDIN
ncbi:TPA: type VI secretion system Vgr family protein [Escherichia coli]